MEEATDIAGLGRGGVDFEVGDGLIWMVENGGGLARKDVRSTESAANGDVLGDTVFFKEGTPDKDVAERGVNCETVGRAGARGLQPGLQGLGGAFVLDEAEC